MEGRPGYLEDPKPLATIRQPLQCLTLTGFTPTLEFSRAASDEPHARLTGPTCFGGCSELAVESHFYYANADDGMDHATITHLTPQGGCEGYTDLAARNSMPVWADFCGVGLRAFAHVPTRLQQTRTRVFFSRRYFKAICTDSDNYRVEAAASASALDKAEMLAASIITDCARPRF